MVQAQVFQLVQEELTRASHLTVLRSSMLLGYPRRPSAPVLLEPKSWMPRLVRVINQAEVESIPRGIVGPA
jgi:hypothetical protein